MKFWSGNQAVVEGALAVGAKFFSGYPITPASEIMEIWAEKAAGQDWCKQTDPGSVCFLQAEDEIAAIHQIIGAVISGVPAFTATSGPGLSLMQEGLGLAFVYRAPIVVVDVMRSGPSTGKPTRAGQGEILSSRFGSHGDNYPFVFYPSSVQECYDFTINAFQVAWKYQVPVILLSDAYLAHMREKVNYHSQLGSETKNGILKRAQDEKKSGENDKIYHFSGLTDRESNFGKIKELKLVANEKYRHYNLWGNEKADTLLVGLGSMGRALRAFEKKYQIYAPIRVWPFLDDEIKKIAEKKKKVIVVEMNEGQYVKKVKQLLGERVEFMSYRNELIDINSLKELIG